MEQQRPTGRLLTTKAVTMEKILVIEDSLLVQSLLSEIFHSEYELEIQGDGLSGLSSAQTSHPDLILLDIRMPGMDGFEVCRILKENNETREIPIIFMTSLDAEADKVKGFRAGANDYVSKPFYQQELRARVKAHLSFRKAKKQALSLERLTLFKELAVAISHEINNPLTSLFAFVHHLQQELTDAPPSVKAALDGISKEVARIHDITGKLAVSAKAKTVRYNRDINMIDFHNL